jgi:hypothetical protein
VAALAYQMSLWMRANRQAVDPLLAHRGGLLHDLAKVASILSSDHQQDHGEMGARMLMEHDQPALAEIARRHLLFSPLSSSNQPVTREQKLVYLMDKLVEGSRLVPVEERIDHLRQRYRLEPDKLDALMPILYEIRDDLCAQAGFPPNEMIARLQSALSAENQTRI